MAETLRTLIETARKGDRQALKSLAGCVDPFVRVHSGALGNHLRKTYGSTVDFVLEGLAEPLASLREFDHRSDEQFYASWYHPYPFVFRADARLLYREGSKSTDIGFRVCFTR